MSHIILDYKKFCDNLAQTEAVKNEIHYDVLEIWVLIFMCILFISFLNF